MGKVLKHLGEYFFGTETFRLYTKEIPSFYHQYGNLCDVNDPKTKEWVKHTKMNGYLDVALKTALSLTTLVTVVYAVATKDFSPLAVPEGIRAIYFMHTRHEKQRNQEQMKTDKKLWQKLCEKEGLEERVFGNYPREDS